MKAVRIHEFGGGQVLKQEEMIKPCCQDDQVLIKVRAASLNPIDWKTRQGIGFCKKDALPFILGWDMSGTIEEIGGNATNFQLGDEVYGLLAFPDIAGTYAEYLVANPAELAYKPKNLGHAAAAAIPLACLTAWQALFDEGGLKAGQKVLIHAAAGGVGHFAVQLAKWCGATVIGTASGARSPWLRCIGADVCIDYHTVKFEQYAQDVDLVLDTQGGTVALRSLATLKKGGKLVTLLGADNARLLEAAERAAVEIRAMRVHADAHALNKITELVETHQLRPYIDRIYSISEACEGHACLEKGHVQGKLVLKIS